MFKQAMTFLSLFALILVLSMYYLIVESNDTPVSLSKLSKIEVLQDQRDETYQNIISKNNDIIASSSSSDEEIYQAISSLESTKDNIKLEKEMSELLKSIGYKECFVEVSDKQVKVICHKKDSSVKDANKIIQALSKQFGTKYYIEVKFITE